MVVGGWRILSLCLFSRGIYTGESRMHIELSSTRRLRWQSLQ
jgi:hypothetical protein